MKKLTSVSVALCAFFVLVSPADARPRAWCGWWMQGHTGITSAATKLNLNMAIEWRKVGHAASGPCVGCLMVERHHISKITAVLGNGMVMAISGNDGRAVRERPRPVRRAVAFRHL